VAFTKLGTLHGELRWFFALLAVVGLGRTIYGLARSRQYSSLDKRFAQIYTLSLDLQILLGLGLYVYLVIDRLDLELAMEWFGWHPLWALAAALVSHLGKDRRRFQVQLGVYGLSLALVLLSVLASPLEGWMRP